MLDMLDLHGERQRHEENAEFRAYLDDNFSDPLCLDEPPIVQDIGPLMHFLQRHDREGMKLYRKQLRENNIQYRLSEILRSRLANALKRLRSNQGEAAKQGSHVKDLGCSLKELQHHLESKFQKGMNWETYGRNRGQWSVDHIIPISSFDLANREEFLKAVHYTNLQPLWNEGKNGQWAKSNKLPEVDQTTADHQH